MKNDIVICVVLLSLSACDFAGQGALPAPAPNINTASFSASDLLVSYSKRSGSVAPQYQWSFDLGIYGDGGIKTETQQALGAPVSQTYRLATDRLQKLLDAIRLLPVPTPKPTGDCPGGAYIVGGGAESLSVFRAAGAQQRADLIAMSPCSELLRLAGDSDQMTFIENLVHEFIPPQIPH